MFYSEKKTVKYCKKSLFGENDNVMANEYRV